MLSGVETHAVIYLSLCNMFIVQFFENNIQLTFIIKQRLTESQESICNRERERESFKNTDRTVTRYHYNELLKSLKVCVFY